MAKIIRHNVVQILLAIDQLANVVLCAVFIPHEKAWADESMSAHACRMRLAGERAWPEKVINALFFWDKDKETGKHHCEMAFDSECYGMQLPPEMRGEKEAQYAG